jgi:hypothetical protein
MASIAGVTVTFGLPENDTRQQNASFGQAQDLTWKYVNYGASNRIISIPLHGLTTTIKDALATALEAQKAGTIAVVAGGSGYHVSDALILAGGTYPVIAGVLTLSGSAVATVSLLYRGSGITTGTKATTVSPAGGSACTIAVSTLTYQLTIAPDSHVDLGAGAGVSITAQWIDSSFEFTKTTHDAWSGILNFVRVV